MRWLLLPVAIAGASTLYILNQPSEVLIDFERSYENAFISGFHQREREGTRAFRWTTGESYVQLYNLPSGKQDIEIRLKVIRPPGQEIPNVWFTANQITAHRTGGVPGEATYRFGFPLRISSLRLGIHSDTFMAGSRRLGVQVLSVRLRSEKDRPPFLLPLLWMMISALLLIGSFQVAGLSLAVSSLLASGFAAVFSYLLAQDSTRFSNYPVEVLLLVAITMGSSAVLRRLFRRSGWFHSSEEPVVNGMVLGTLLLKLGALTYPLIAISDAQFHAHRLSELLQGHFFITSVSQHTPPFRIPYPVSLYVLAAPWAAAGLDKIAVLEILTALADVGIGLVLILWARRFLNDTRAGVLAAVVYQLVPLNFLAFSAGNFTNLFGVATTVGFLGFLTATGSGASAATGAFAFSLLALTSHFGTFLMDIVLWPISLAGIGWLTAPGPPNRHRRSLLIAVAVSVAVVLVYYAGYRELFTAQWERVLGRDYASGEAAVTGPLAKLAFNLPYWKEQLGLVFTVLATVGAVPILRRATASPFHVVAVAWLGVAFLFLILDLTTALETRYLLQVLPLLALLAGSYLSGALRRGKTGKVAAVAALGYLLTLGLFNLRDCLLIRYH